MQVGVEHVDLGEVPLRPPQELRDPLLAEVAVPGADPDERVLSALEHAAAGTGEGQDVEGVLGLWGRLQLSRR